MKSNKIILTLALVFALNVAIVSFANDKVQASTSVIATKTGVVIVYPNGPMDPPGDGA